MKIKGIIITVIALVVVIVFAISYYYSLKEKAACNMTRLFDIKGFIDSSPSFFEEFEYVRDRTIGESQLRFMGAGSEEGRFVYYNLILPDAAAILPDDRLRTTPYILTGPDGVIPKVDNRDKAGDRPAAWWFSGPVHVVKEHIFKGNSPLRTKFYFPFESNYVRFDAVALDEFEKGSEPVLVVRIGSETIGELRFKQRGKREYPTFLCSTTPGGREVVIEVVGNSRITMNNLRIGAFDDSIVVRILDGHSAAWPVRLSFPKYDVLHTHAKRFMKANCNWNKVIFRPEDILRPVTLSTESPDRKRTLRSMILSAPAVARADIVLPENPVLEFHYGFLDDTIFQNLQVRLLERGSDKVLLDDVITSNNVRSNVWYQRKIDLSRFGGRRVTVEFEFHRLQDALAALFLGEPVIRSRQRIQQGRPNVILISLDTLRGDRLGCNGYRRDTTPFIDKLASEEGVVFTRAFSQASWTLPSHKSMLTGFYPQLLDNSAPIYSRKIPYPEGLPNLATYLRAAGYYCAGITEGGYVSSFHGFAGEFDYYNELNFANNNKIANTSRGKRRVKRTEFGTASDWIRDNYDKEPFFLFLHSFAPHFPYAPPAQYDRLFEDTSELDMAGEIERLRQMHLDGSVTKFSWDDIKLYSLLYDRQIRWVDDQISQFYSTLLDLGILENTLLIITADHGEEFFEHGGLSHGKTVYNEVMLVPLIIRLPQQRFAGTTINSNVSVVDIVPTVLDLLGVKPPLRLQGTSLLPMIRLGMHGSLRKTVFISSWHDRNKAVAAVGEKLKYIVVSHNDGRLTEELYNMYNDWGEKNNLISDAEVTSSLDFVNLRNKLLYFLAENMPGWNVLVLRSGTSENIRIIAKGFETREAGWFVASGAALATQIGIAHNVTSVKTGGRPFLLTLDGMPGDDFAIHILSNPGSAIGTIGVGLPVMKKSVSPVVLGSEFYRSRRFPFHLGLPTDVVGRYNAIIWHTKRVITFVRDRAILTVMPKEMEESLKNLGYLQ